MDIYMIPILVLIFSDLQELICLQMARSGIQERTQKQNVPVYGYQSWWIHKCHKGLHIDYGNNNTGLMVEAALMRRNQAVTSIDFLNQINSPGEKMLTDAYQKNRALYDDIMKKADDFEAEFKQLKGIKCHQIKIYEKILMENI